MYRHMSNSYCLISYSIILFMSIALEKSNNIQQNAFQTACERPVIKAHLSVLLSYACALDIITLAVACAI